MLPENGDHLQLRIPVPLPPNQRHHRTPLRFGEDVSPVVHLADFLEI